MTLPLTPSNSSPATITSGNTYTATADGKAVETITNVTPSSTPTSVSADDVVHIGGSGVIVDAVKTEQTKSVTATTSQQTVSPDTGYTLSSVTVNPQQHSGTYTPAANTAQNDMTAVHNYRYVNTSGMTDTSDANAIAADILYPKTAYVGGSKITGSMTDRGAAYYTLASKSQTVTIPKGYHNGSGTVNISQTEQNKIIASNIKSGVNILGVDGSLTPGITPTGNLPIDSNGTYDVTNYASATVNVEQKWYYSLLNSGTFAIKSANGTKSITVPSFFDDIIIFVSICRNSGGTNLSVKSLSAGSYIQMARYTGTTVSSSSEEIGALVLRLFDASGATLTFTTSNYVAAARWVAIGISVD